jgi:hypothetical protein
MFNKVATNQTISIEALNRPTGWEEYEGSQELSLSRIKIASMDKEDRDDDLGGFDLTSAVEERPDHLFVKVFAIKKDEVNDNGDAFSGEELKKAAETFIGVPVFCNHANDDIEKARGMVVHAWYDSKKGGIYTINRVDKVAYPKLARGIEEGYISGTSMGCQVHHSCCSICHNMAHTADEYCDHIRNRKTKKHSGKTKCNYSKSKCKPDGDCPVCGCTKGDEKELQHKEAQIYEHNFGLKFIEDSFVVNPACHDCLVDTVLNVPEFVKKVASTVGGLRDITGNMNEEELTKAAGQLEIEYLNKAMKFMSVVAKSMLDQKEIVSMDYLSDVTEVLADLQKATDELVEMGYGTIPSPPSLENPDLTGDAVSADSGGATNTGGQQPPQQAAPQGQQKPPTPSGASSSPSGIGSVTKPSFSPSASANKKEVQKHGENIREKIEHLTQAISQYVNTHQNTKESVAMADKNQKVAAGPGTPSDQHQVTTQKQLEEYSKKSVLHGRTYDAPDGTTESDQQLGRSSEPVNDTTTQSPQIRQDKYPNEVVEGQLTRPVFGNGFIERWDSYPDVILEKTWTDFSREVGSVLSTDQSEHTTEAQLQDLLSHHTWTEPNYTTESQLASDENWATKDNAWLDKSASASYSKKLVTAAIESLSDAIAFYQRTPSELVKATKFICRDPQSQIKAAFITLVNGIPSKRAARKEEIERSRYFGKLSTEASTPDYLLACMGDHCLNLKAEDLVDAVRHIASDPTKMAAVEAAAKVKKEAKVTVPSEEVVDKYAAMNEAFADVTNPEGMYEVRIYADEIGGEGGGLADDGSPVDGDAFVTAADRHCRTLLASNADVVLYAVDFDPEDGSVIAQYKDKSKLSKIDKAAATAVERSKVASSRSTDREKVAQMMGGEMGGQGGAAGAPGAGASLPAPPGGGDAGGAPPMENLDAPPGEEDGSEEGGDKEALPPGSICPVCGSEDVDIVDGKGKCNNCNSQFVFKVEVEVTRWTGVNDKNSDDQGEDGEDEGAMGDEGEGFPMPEEGGPDAGGDAPAPSIPVAAMTLIKHDRLNKLAKAGIPLGTISPFTGSKNTYHVAGTKHFCMDTGKPYDVVLVPNVADPKAGVAAEWRWTPVMAKWKLTDGGLRLGQKSEPCPSCRRARSSFAKALKKAGIEDSDFESMNFKRKADTIIAMEAKGLLGVVKTASKNITALGELKKAFNVPGKFPIESCREKLARRYGKEALALSGPCKGEKLYDCVCNQLKSASMYSDSLATKFADTWKDRDACVECMEDYTRIGYELETAASVCQHMKMKYAQPVDMASEELTDDAGMTGGDDVGGDSGFGDTGMDTGGMDDSSSDDMGGASGAFDDGMGGGDVPEEEPTGTAEMGDDGMDINAPAPDMGLPGGEEDTITIEIPKETVKQMVLDRLAPGASEGAELGGGPMEIPLGGIGDEVADLAGDAIGGLEDGSGEGEDVALDVEPDGGGDDTEFSEDSEGDGESPLDSGDDDGSDDDTGDDFGGGDNDSGGPPEDIDSGDYDEDNEEGGLDKDEFKKAHRLAQQMRSGKRVGQIDLNLSKLLALPGMKEALRNKKAFNEGTTPTLESSQDVVDDYSNGKTIGHEQKFDPSKPSVPRSNATMGKEDSDLNPKDKPLPHVPSGDAEIGHEAELGYTSEKPSMSGGLSGAGKSPTTSASKKGGVLPVHKSVIAPKTAQQRKLAEEKKLAPAEPDSEVTEVDYSDNKDLSSTPEHLKRKPFSEEDSKEIRNIPEKGEGAFIGKEKESIDFVPKAPERQPSIPVGGGRNPKYDRNEKNAPEMQDKIKGTVIARDDKSREVKAKAFEVATKMFEAKMIEATDMMDKVAQLQRYDLTDLKILENSIFKSASKKGLATAPDGLEGSPVIISAESNGRSKGDLQQQLQSLFKLNRQNEEASKYRDAASEKGYAQGR